MADNFLLQALNHEDRERLASVIRPVTFEPGETLYEPGDEAGYVYFPTSGLLSIINIMANGDSVETSAVGRESAVGFLEACGGGAMRSRVIVQIAGSGWRSEAAQYREAFNQSQSLRQAVSQHVELLLTEARQEIGCHTMHTAVTRLARWLLVCADKTGDQQVELSQELLAALIGTQRTTISGVAAALKDRGLIIYGRGRINSSISMASNS